MILKVKTPRDVRPEPAPSEGKGGKSRVFISAAITLLLICIFAIGALTACNPGKNNNNGNNNTPTPVDGYFSPTALAASEDGKYLYVADATGCAVYKLQTEDGKVAATYQTDVKVNDVEVAGDYVLVAEGELGGRLVKLDSSLKASGSVVTGHTPSDICVNGNNVYVANRFSNTVSCVDIKNMKVTAAVDVSREPVALALAGSDLYVGCHLPDEAGDAKSISSNVCVIDTAGNTLTDKIDLCNGAGSLRGICASPDGSTVYATHIVSRYQYPTTQLDGGWINTNAVSVIDASKKAYSYSFLLDDVDLGASNPWGVTVTEDGNTLYVALSGTNQICEVNLTKLKSLVRNATKTGGKTNEQLVDMIDLAQDAKSRLTLDGSGFRSILIKDGKIYSGAYFTGGIAVVDAKKFALTETLTVKEQPEMSDIRMGELLWYDATTCYQMWESCNSCHPDGRADSFNWDNLNDGVGTSKQAKSMLYTHRTPPVMLTGIRANAEVAVIAGYRFIEYNADYSEYVKYIDAYLKAMQPVQSPHLNDDGTLTEAAAHGKELFEQFKCTTCHPAPLYTDMKFHLSEDLELGDDWEYREFDTPTLVEIWRTAPWAYNGHFTDMTEYIKFMVTKKGMTISDADAADLAEYVLSIGNEGEEYGVIQLFNDDSTYNKFKAGTAITSVSVIKQKAGAADGKLTVTVYDASGKALGSAEVELKDLVYGEIYTFEFGSPLATAGGAYVTASFKDGSGKALATDLKID